MSHSYFISIHHNPYWSQIKHINSNTFQKILDIVPVSQYFIIQSNIKYDNKSVTEALPRLMGFWPCIVVKFYIVSILPNIISLTDQFVVNEISGSQ